MAVSTPIKVQDLARAIARVDVNASADPGDVIPGDSAPTYFTGVNDPTFGAMLSDVASGIASEFDRAGLTFRKITDETVVAILAAYGMSPFALTEWAADIADRLRSDFGHGKWSSESLANIAAESRQIADARDSE